MSTRTPYVYRPRTVQSYRPVHMHACAPPPRCTYRYQCCLHACAPPPPPTTEGCAADLALPDPEGSGDDSGDASALKQRSTQHGARYALDMPRKPRPSSAAAARATIWMARYVRRRRLDLPRMAQIFSRHTMTRTDKP